MVRIDHSTTDTIVGWRVRDALAAHPLLGGHMARIKVVASYEGVILEGWVHDDHVMHLAVKLARRAAGSRSIQANLQSGCCKQGELQHC